MPTVSVIIPCYNHGRYLDEAVDSVLGQTLADLEIVIVDDGSTDAATVALLDSYQRPRTTVLRTANMGLAAARNNGIAAASGTYILPLDADDRIEPTYLEQAVAVLEGRPEVGIVYCRARLFGAVETEWLLPDYSLSRMLLDNLIFCTAMFRREDWEAVGGYDRGMVYGWEDYDFWLGLIERGRRVVRLDDILFCYRVASDSMVRSKEKWQKVEMFQRIYLRHRQLFSDNIAVWLDKLVEVNDRYHSSRLYVDCGQGIGDESSVVRKVDAGTRRIVFALDGYEAIEALRFDPVDTWAVVELGDITLRYDNGHSRLVTGSDSNALYRQGTLSYFGSPDPQVHFPRLGPGDYRGLREVEVELRFIALGEAALERLVAYQRERLQTLAGETLPRRAFRAGGELLRRLRREGEKH